MHGADSTYLRYQYSDSEKLRIRIQSHELYSECKDQQDGFHAWVIRHLRLTPGQTLLDLGCGPGTYHQSLRPHGLNLIAVDASLGMLHEAQQQGREGHLSVRLVQADLQALPLPDSIADCAMANHVLYHVPNQSQALSEMRRVVKPCGLIVITTNASSSSRRLKDIHQWAASEAGYTPIGTADAALRYYASGYVDQIAEWQPGSSHAAQLLPLVRGRLEEIIAREGVFRDDKTVGCFVAPN